jgi:hypothetical protein
VLENNLINFNGNLNNDQAVLSWAVLENQFVKYFDIERSIDGVNFSSIARVEVQPENGQSASYTYSDNVLGLATRNVYYRIRMKDVSNKNKISNIIRIPLSIGKKSSVTIMPNPVKDIMQLQISCIADSRVDMNIYDQSGKIVSTMHTSVQKGNNVMSLNLLADKPRGIYQALISVGGELFSQKILLTK